MLVKLSDLYCKPVQPPPKTPHPPSITLRVECTRATQRDPQRKHTKNTPVPSFVGASALMVRDEEDMCVCVRLCVCAFCAHT